MEKWNFEENKKFILEHCSKPNWADDNEEPILESTINETISIAHEIQSYFLENDYDLDQPHFGQCGDGSIDLHWDSFEKGYSVLYNYYVDILSRIEESLYADNICRNWKNRDEIELIIVNTIDSRKVLVLFAKWCKKRKIDWKIEIKKSEYYDR